MHVRAFATVVAAEDATGITVGDHVDVIISVPYPDAGMTTVPLLVNLPVFAISVDPSRDRAVVTLLVLPEESAMLADAEAAGHLSLVVRNPKDPDEGRRSDGRWPKATDRELLDPGD